MSPNPYAPPVAEVANHQPIANIEKPFQIVLAVRMLWTSVSLAMMNALATAARLDNFPLPTIVGLLFYSFVPMSLMAWLIVKISGGRNWARITLLVLVLLSTAAIIVRMRLLSGLRATMFLDPSLSWDFFRQLLPWVQRILLCASVSLLFIGTGRRWFAPRE